MASITIRKLDEKVKAKLRVRAALHGHSMEEEVREILISAVQEERPQKAENLYTAMRKRLTKAGFEGIDLPEPDRGPWRETPDFSA
jgi:plasmid stability protein